VGLLRRLRDALLRKKATSPNSRDLIALTPEEIREERGIDLRTGHEVVGVDTESQTVTVAADGETFDQAYDHLLIGTGAGAVVPPFDGTDLDGVFTIHDMDEADAIERYVTEGTPRVSAAIVGGGYVGIRDGRGALCARPRRQPVRDAAQRPATVRRGRSRTWSRTTSETRESTYTSITAVAGFAGEGRVDEVHLDGGDSHSADIAIVGVGVKPNAALAENAAIERRPTGAIATDEYGRTSAANVYAAGDCAEDFHVVTGEPGTRPAGADGESRWPGHQPDRHRITHGCRRDCRHGHREGIRPRRGPDRHRRRGAGPRRRLRPRVGRSPTRRGPTTTRGTRRSRSCSSRTARRAPSWAGASSVATAQKRIDTVATALHGGLTVTELQNADLAYAPPFSPVWDPVLTAAKVFAGKLER